MFNISKFSKDTTIYQHLPELNAGNDPQLELIKYRVGDIIPTQGFEFQEWPTTSVSRILLDIDISNLSIGEHRLILHISTMSELTSKQINIKISRILDVWQEGFGNRNDFPHVNSGATWLSTGSTVWSNPYLAISDSLSHTIQSTDDMINVDISDLINYGIEHPEEWNGLAIIFADEDDVSSKYEIRFYGSDTQSIYEPSLISYYADATSAGTFNPTMEFDPLNYDISVQNIKPRYQSGLDTVLFKVKCTKLVDTKTYNSTLLSPAEYNITAFFQIVDSVTGKVVVPFNELGTKLQKTNMGYVIKFDTSNIIPNRYYTIQIRITYNGDNFIYDNNLNFLIQ